MSPSASEKKHSKSGKLNAHGACSQWKSIYSVLVFMFLHASFTIKFNATFNLIKGKQSADC